MSAQPLADLGSLATGRRAEPAPILKTERLSVRFGGLSALSEVNFEVPRGEVRAIIGPNGAGKSTFFNCLTGVLRPSGGRIIDGEDTRLPSNAISQKASRAPTRSRISCPTPQHWRTCVSPPNRAVTVEHDLHITARSPISIARRKSRSMPWGFSKRGSSLRTVARRTAQSRDRHRARHRAKAPFASTSRPQA